MERQICSRCKIEKPFNEYHKDSEKKNGLKKMCKECTKKANRERYRGQAPLERQIRNIATNILSRTSGRRDREQYFDRGIECRIGKNIPEVMSYLRENFAEDIQAMLDRGEQVSISRIDSKKHYEHGNLQIMEFKESSLKSALNGGKTTQELFGHVVFIKDLETGEIIKAPSKVAASKIIGCSNTTISRHLNRNSPAPIFGRYEITRESE